MSDRACRRPTVVDLGRWARQTTERRWTVYLFQGNKPHSAYRHTGLAFHLEPDRADRCCIDCLLLQSDFVSSDRPARIHQNLPFRIGPLRQRGPSFSVIEDETLFRTTTAWFEEIGTLTLSIARLVKVLARVHASEYELLGFNCRDYMDAVRRDLGPALVENGTYGRRMQVVRTDDHRALVAVLGLVVLFVVIVALVFLSRRKKI